jgi:hypothetical protein
MPDGRWIRLGGFAGMAYVLVALVGAALTGAPPGAEGGSTAYQNYLIERQDLLVAQAWLYALGAPLLLTFAVSVRRVLRRPEDGGFLSELFVIGQAVIATLLVGAMGMQVAFAQAADAVPAGEIFAVGVHSVAVVLGLAGFITGMTAWAFGFCVFTYGVLPRWTAYLAALAFVMCVGSTAGVFFGTGRFVLEGGLSAWAAAGSTLLWYLGTSVAVLRTPDGADSPS